MQSYRVFISYAHNDKAFVERIARILEDNMLIPIYDKDIPAGSPFDEHIKKYISYSHVFMPLITSESYERGWVHQEIGYALALNIPVLPVSKEQLPAAMIERLNACVVDEGLTDAASKLSYGRIDDLVKKCGPNKSMYLCRFQAEERARLIAEYAEDVMDMNGPTFLRQKGGLSSFQIPNEEISDPVWEERYDTVLKNEYHCECQLKERRALEAHVIEVGCRIVINPRLVASKQYSSIAQRARIGTFLDFLKRMPDDKIDIAIDPHLTFSESVTVLGNWFSAESYYRPETQGFKQTMFTRHAPGIKSKIDVFDSEFNSLIKRNNLKQGQTRENAIELLEGILRNLQTD
jgi:hypothetical protein